MTDPAHLSTYWYQCRVCGSPANPAPSFNGQEMAARCTKCANHDQSPLVVGGRRVSKATANASTLAASRASPKPPQPTNGRRMNISANSHGSHDH